jgi:hypothetical protein
VPFVVKPFAAQAKALTQRAQKKEEESNETPRDI